MFGWSSKLIGGLMGGLLLAACGGGDGGTGPGGGGGPSGAERTAMAAALTAAAANATTANDGLGALLLQGASAMISGGIEVTSVSGIVFSRTGAEARRLPAAFSAAKGWAFGVELALTQGQAPQVEVGVFEGAVLISGTNIAYGFGRISATPGFVGSSFGAIWQGANAGWAATTVIGTGVADSILGGNCTTGVPSNLGIADCVPASLRGPAFNISASTPMNFPGNTATGSIVMAFGQARLRGAQVTVDCEATTYC